jgi:hypothetical protein
MSSTFKHREFSVNPSTAQLLAETNSFRIALRKINRSYEQELSELMHLEQSKTLVSNLKSMERLLILAEQSKSVDELNNKLNEIFSFYLHLADKLPARSLTELISKVSPREISFGILLEKAKQTSETELNNSVGVLKNIYVLGNITNPNSLIRRGGVSFEGVVNALVQGRFPKELALDGKYAHGEVMAPTQFYGHDKTHRMTIEKQFKNQILEVYSATKLTPQLLERAFKESTMLFQFIRNKSLDELNQREHEALMAILHFIMYEARILFHPKIKIDPLGLAVQTYDQFKIEEIVDFDYSHRELINIGNWLKQQIHNYQNTL